MMWRLHTFSLVMALGILSTAAELRGLGIVSLVLLLAACAGFLVLLALDARTLAHIRPRADDLRTALVLFTFVAADGVLADRLPEALVGIEIACGLVALAAWALAAGIFVASLRRRGRPRSWELNGSSLLAVVATQSLVIFAGTIASQADLPGLAVAGFALWLVALGAYIALATLIVVRFVTHVVHVHDLTPDYWIVSGALAISVVALVGLHRAGSALGVARFQNEVVLTCAALLTIAVLWIPVQLWAELARTIRGSNAWGHEWLRWSTVFPLGMLAVATSELGSLARVGDLGFVADVSLWAGVAVALLNTSGAITKASAE